MLHFYIRKASNKKSFNNPILLKNQQPNPDKKTNIQILTKNQPDSINLKKPVSD
jgi:hypothetical protein